MTASVLTLSLHHYMKKTKKLGILFAAMQKKKREEEANVKWKMMSCERRINKADGSVE